MSPVDLHTHSNKSDGTLTPSELVRYASQKGLSAIALTDHDTVDGIDEAIHAAGMLGQECGSADRAAPAPGTAVEVIPGIELSTELNGKDIHILGLFIDWRSAGFTDRLREFSDARVYRNRKMCRLLTDGGYIVDYEALEEAFPDTVITRAHFAQYLLSCGMIGSVEEAFRKLIGDHCPYFVPREKITPQDAVKFLHCFGGVPILAHPLKYNMSDNELREMLSSLCRYGLAGIEVYYSGHKPADTAYLCRIADQYGLLYCGGSDFHGSRKKGLDLGTGYGHLYVPDSILPPIREAAEKLRSRK